MNNETESPSVACGPTPGGGDGSPVLFDDIQTPKVSGAMAPPDKPVDKPDLPVDPNRNKKDGRYKEGNTVNKTAKRGGYNCSKMAKMRAALLDAVTPEQLVTVLAAMIVKAVAGDVAAASLVFERVLGKALPADTLERLARIEGKLSLSADLDPEQIAAEGQVVKRTRVAAMLFEAVEAKGAAIGSYVSRIDEPIDGGDAEEGQ